MTTISVTNARKDLFNLVDIVEMNHEPALLIGKRTNAILVSETDWNAIQETLSLTSIPGMGKSILSGMDVSLKECVSEDKVVW